MLDMGHSDEKAVDHHSGHSQSAKDVAELVEYLSTMHEALS